MKYYLLSLLLFMQPCLAENGDKEKQDPKRLFDNPIELFAGALLPGLSHSERAKVVTTLRGFYLRADTQPGMNQEYDPSDAGIYLDASVRDPEEIPAFEDATTTEGSITKRTVEIPAPKGGEVALRITLEYGKDASVESLAAIRASIADTIKAGEPAGAAQLPVPMSSAKYGPGITTLAGTIVEQPYGEDASPSEQGKSAWILKLQNPISVEGKPGDEIDVDEKNVSEIHLNIDHSKFPIPKDEFGQTLFQATGTLHHAHTTHHLRSIVMIAHTLKAGQTSAPIHPATVSPSGKYKLGSQSIVQSQPDVTQGSLGSNILLIGRDGGVISKCYSPSDAYIDLTPETRGRDEWLPKAYWNKDETLAAVYSGGRTWSRIDFYSISQDRIAILPHPNWSYSIFRDLKGYVGKTTRLYEVFEGWMTHDICVMNVSGTAELNEAQPDRYPDFSYRVKVRIAMDGIQIMEIKKAGDGDKPEN